MLRLYLYARVLFLHTFAHETAGAASTRHSLRPLFLGGPVINSSGVSRREIAESYSVEAASLRAKRLVRRSSTSEGGINPLSPRMRKDGLLRGARHRAALRTDPLARNDGPSTRNNSQQTLLRVSGDCVSRS